MRRLVSLALPPPWGGWWGLTFFTFFFILFIHSSIDYCFLGTQ
jgi:hypothetical protein